MLQLFYYNNEIMIIGIAFIRQFFSTGEFLSLFRQTDDKVMQYKNKNVYSYILHKLKPYFNLLKFFILSFNDPNDDIMEKGK